MIATLQRSEAALTSIPEVPQPTRLDCVDLVRTLAIMGPIAAHLLGLGASTLPKDWVYPIFFHGAYGIIFFFVVSGFIISFTTAAREKNLYKPDVKRFYQNRCARILPLLALIILIGAFCKTFAPLGMAPPFHACFWNPERVYDNRFWVSISTFWFNWQLIMARGNFGFHWDVLWTLSIEEQFYMLFPFVLIACRNSATFSRVLLSVVVGAPLMRAVVWLYGPAKFIGGLANSFSNFDQIAIGCLLFLCWQKYGERLKGHPRLQWTLVIAGALLTGITYYVTSPFDQKDRIFAPTIIAAGVAMFLLGAIGNKAFQRLPQALVVPGRLSYGMYLYQALAMYIICPVICGKPFAFALPVYILAIMGIAAVSYKLYEKPANKYLRNLGRVTNRQVLTPTCHHTL
jgi:peptidoglycan/LPS O-acetylase OafA/YrhL